MREKVIGHDNNIINMGKNNNQTQDSGSNSTVVIRSISIPKELDARLREENIRLSGMATDLLTEEMDAKDEAREFSQNEGDAL